MANKESANKTIIVALLLCVVCSVIVSTAAVLLRPMQIENKALDFKRNILAAAGLLKQDLSVEEQFAQITTKLVDLDSGLFVADANGIPVDKFDQRKSAKDPALSSALDGDVDIAKIARRENIAKVYLVEAEGQLETVILPIKGYGLWSTLRGFLALEADASTIVGIGFYEHGETPGLGGEVDNPKWKALWVGKKIYADQASAIKGDVALDIIKGNAAPDAVHDIDGLSGATLTSRGVANLVKFWLGENGYAPFLTKLKNGEA